MLPLQIFLTIIALIGLFSSFLGLPGILLIYLCVCILVFVEGFTSISLAVFAIFTTLVVISFILDEAFVLIGAKKFGASKYALLGAFCGMIIGFFVIPVLGVLIGPFIGAVIGEFLYDKNLKKALNAGFGTALGYLVGSLSKILLSFILLIWFLILLW